MIRKAVIVAAGKSSRLYPRTLEYPKPLLPLGETSLIERSIQFLLRREVDQIGVVVGYQADKIRRKLSSYTKVSFIDNPFYGHCNNMGSLWMARDFIGDDSFLYLHGDLAYDSKLLDYFVKSEEEKQVGQLLVDFGPVDEEAMKVKVDCNRVLIESNKEIDLDVADGEWTGIAFLKSPKAVFDSFSKFLMNGDLNQYDTAAFSELTKQHKYIFECISTEQLPWIEIDFEEDYMRAKDLFGDCTGL